MTKLPAGPGAAGVLALVRADGLQLMQWQIA